MKKVNYLCLQATREGQASYAHVHEIINGLRSRGWQVELFEPAYASADVLPGCLIRLIEFLRVQVKLWRKIQGRDILYIRAHFAAFPSALLARLLHFRVVQEVNGPYEDLFIAWPWTRYFSTLFKWLLRVQLRWANAVVVVTPQLEEWVREESGQTRIYIVPNGANIDLFYPEATSNYQIEKPYVVFFGALAPWQGIDTMIQAAELPEWPEPVKLVIIGDGAERFRVEEALTHNPKIVYMGKLPYRELPGIVANSLAGLVPKNSKGGYSYTGLFPLKLFETLACGVPVVVTDFSGQADLVRKYGCGLVVSSDDPHALAEAVAYLYQNLAVAKTMGQRGRKAIEEEHSWDKRAADTESVLLEVLRMSDKDTQ